MNDSETLRKMARIVMQNPTATAREITEKMGYAQEKSVYYWLRKAGFRGIVDFRQAVLTGNFPPPDDFFTRLPIATDQQGKYMRRSIPVLGDFSKFVGATLSKLRPRFFLNCPGAISKNGFALIMDLPDYHPAVQRDDIIAIDPDQESIQGDILLVSSVNRGNLLGHIYGKEESRLLISPTNPGYAITFNQEGFTVLGRVVALIRQY